SAGGVRKRGVRKRRVSNCGVGCRGRRGCGRGIGGRLIGSHQCIGGYGRCFRRRGRFCFGGFGWCFLGKRCDRRRVGGFGRRRGEGVWCLRETAVQHHKSRPERDE